MVPPSARPNSADRGFGAFDPTPCAAVPDVWKRLAEWNQVRNEQGETLIRHGLCVHFGRVLYGNVGSSQRLDLTIIGQPVNVAARGVDATRGLDADYLFTGDVVKSSGVGGEVPIGARNCKGIPQTVELFTFAAAVRETDEAQIFVSA